MKKMNERLSVLVICCVLAAASSVFGLSSWDMTGPTVQKTVMVPTNEPNYPDNLIEQERTVIEDSDGDIVFGMWREDNDDLTQNPSIEDGALRFYGLQSAYIPEIGSMATSIERIAFDFKPASISSQGFLAYIAWVIHIRVEPHSSDGTARVRTYLHCEGDNLVNVRSSYTLQVDTWHHVECWIEDGYLYMSLDGQVLDEGGSAEIPAPIKSPVYPNVYLGSSYSGTSTHYDGSIDNLEISFFEPECGDWGYYDADFNNDCYIDIADFAHLASIWLNCTDPTNENCVQLQ